MNQAAADKEASLEPCVAGDSSGAIGAELARISKELGIRPMANLWHAILFYTSGELTRRALAKRGVSKYQPLITFMYEGSFRGFRPSLSSQEATMTAPVRRSRTFACPR